MITFNIVDFKSFVANLFNKYPNLETDDKIEAEPVALVKETREEKTFRNWINSMGVNPNVNYLYTDLRDCSIIFQVKIKNFNCNSEIELIS